MSHSKVEDSKVIEVYNTQGKKAAMEMIRTVYGVSDAYYVLRRLKASSAYVYDSSKDTFSKSMDTPFLELDELCVETNTREMKTETQQSSMYTSNEKRNRFIR